MENPLINTLDFHLNHPPRSSQIPNGSIISSQNDAAGQSAEDIEMIAFENMNYTSLKDLMPVSPMSTASPTGSRRDSWREIPIKDPLVQHAAWAYLQPMAAERDEDVRWWVLLKDKCCGLFGCMKDVVLVVFFSWLPEQQSDHRDEDCKVD